MSIFFNKRWAMAAAMTAVMAAGGGAVSAAPIPVLPQSAVSPESGIIDARYRRRHAYGGAAAAAALGLFALGASGAYGYGYGANRYDEDPYYGRPRYYGGYEQPYYGRPRYDGGYEQPYYRTYEYGYNRPYRRHYRHYGYRHHSDRVGRN